MSVYEKMRKDFERAAEIDDGNTYWCSERHYYLHDDYDSKWKLWQIAKYPTKRDSSDIETYTITICQELIEGEMLYVGRVVEFPNISSFTDTADDAFNLVVDAITTLRKLQKKLISVAISTEK